jgi:hypothetical protein
MPSFRVGPFVLKNDGTGYWTGTLRLPGWRALFGARRGRLDVEIPGEGEGGDEPPNAVRMRGCRWLVAHDASAARRVLSALLAELPALRPRYARAGIAIPEVRSVVELARLVTPTMAVFHTARRGTGPCIGYEFRCPWDVEHGAGVMMHGLRVVQAGGADTALLEWIAERDARKGSPRRR